MRKSGINISYLATVLIRELRIKYRHQAPSCASAGKLITGGARPLEQSAGCRSGTPVIYTRGSTGDGDNIYPAIETASDPHARTVDRMPGFFCCHSRPAGYPVVMDPFWGYRKPINVAQHSRLFFASTGIGTGSHCGNCFASFGRGARDFLTPNKSPSAGVLRRYNGSQGALRASLSLCSAVDLDLSNWRGMTPCGRCSAMWNSPPSQALTVYSQPLRFSLAERPRRAEPAEVRPTK